MVLEEYFSKRGRHGESFVKLLAFSYRVIPSGARNLAVTARVTQITPNTAHIECLAAFSSNKRGLSWF
jgi:hypothetical protein